ncbi:NAD(P)-binding protein [Nocardia sp. CA-084685]|uniref:NAD(P)-binding protein n=1 Tax=Nocardia sp. CA-084685 TaxID=3239970 RepID=UPI003D97D189
MSADRKVGPHHDGQHRIVVLGAGYAGLAAARRLARTARDAHITVVDARASFIERVRLHQ